MSIEGGEIAVLEGRQSEKRLERRGHIAAVETESGSAKVDRTASRCRVPVAEVAETGEAGSDERF